LVEPTAAQPINAADTIGMPASDAETYKQMELAYLTLKNRVFKAVVYFKWVVPVLLAYWPRTNADAYRGTTHYLQGTTPNKFFKGHI
jgi:hypothetical protein